MTGEQKTGSPAALTGRGRIVTDHDYPEKEPRVHSLQTRGSTVLQEIQFNIGVIRVVILTHGMSRKDAEENRKWRHTLLKSLSSY